MTRIHINASTPYDVVIEEGALQRITDYIKPLKPNCRVIIVSDSNVAPHYLDSVKAILRMLLQALFRDKPSYV